jgi:hypothetical protein
MRHHEYALQELRPLMQQHALSDEERAHVWWLLERAARQDFDATASRVIPYLRGFPHHYAGALCKVETLEHLELAARLLPGARLWFAFPRQRLTDHVYKKDLLRHMPEFGAVSRLWASGGRRHPRFTGDLYAPDLTEGASCVVALSKNPSLVDLDELAIEQNLIDDDQLIEIFTWLDTPIQAIRMGGNAFGARGLGFFGAQEPRRGLRSLSVVGGDLDALAIEAIVGGPHAGSLRALDLSGNNLMGHSTGVLAAASGLRNLEVLSLRNGRLRDLDMPALAGAEHLASVKTLSLEGNRITQAGVETLMRSEVLSDAAKACVRAAYPSE